MIPIAALFVDAKGCYAGFPGVHVWDIKRDARLYEGPWPVVAHPPCARWCMLAGLTQARHGLKRGEDGGCFESALNSVRRFGGVLEHPAHSRAWFAFGLPKPHPDGGWQRGLCGGWACQVEQGRYGHPARKATWLYAYGIDSAPSLRWGFSDFWPVDWRNGKQRREERSDAEAERKYAVVSWCGNRGLKDVPRVSKKQASATPHEFRDILIAIARSAAKVTS